MMKPANDSFHSIAPIRLPFRLGSGDQIAGLGGSWILSQRERAGVRENGSLRYGPVRNSIA